MTNEEGDSISQIIGGELATLAIKVIAERALQSPIISFHVLDRLGQILFADNSYLMSDKKSFNGNAGTNFTAKFSFHMPLLPTGSYVIRAIVALKNSDGNIEILKTVNNALAFHSVTSGARHGFVGVPMHSIKLKYFSNTTDKLRHVI